VFDAVSESECRVMHNVSAVLTRCVAAAV
jgi:hypothetical protein